MGKKHIPIRTCIACRTSRPKRELVRIVRTPEQTLVLDADQKARGRGAYLCRQRACWERVVRRPRILSNALKYEISEEDIQHIRRYIETTVFESDETSVQHP